MHYSPQHTVGTQKGLQDESQGQEVINQRIN